MKIRTKTLVAAGCVGCFAVSPYAFAQDASVPQDSSADARTDVHRDSGTEISDIVVTAQRREERLQDVPIAITAIGGDSAEIRAIRSTVDLAAAVPGLHFGQGPTGTGAYIRGIGNRNSNPGDEPATGTYVDGVYIASFAASVFSLASVERVEVLKGPQGTLFGRNSAAGVIQVVTRRPSTTPLMEASVGYANFETINSNLYVTGGLGQNLAVDFSAYYENQGEGWGRNLFTGSEAFKGYQYGMRSKLLFTPSEATEITIAGDYYVNSPAAQNWFRAPEDRPLASGAVYAGFFNPNTTIDNDTRNRQWGVSGRIEHSFDWATLTSISAYRNSDSRLQNDLDGGPALIQHARFVWPQRTWTQELQLSSAAGSPVQWVVGAFYLNDLSRYNPIQIEGAAGVTQIFSRQEVESIAPYAQVTIPVTDSTRVTLGARYTIDKHGSSGEIITPAGVVIPVAKREVTYKDPTWRVAVDQKIGQDLLLYASYNRGFKSGIWNAVGIRDPAVSPQTVDAYEIGFKSDLFDRRLRFNISAYYMDFKNLQVTQPVPGGTRTVNAAASRSKGVDLEIDAVPVRNLTLHAGLALLNSKFTSFPDAQFYAEQPNGANVIEFRDADGNYTPNSPKTTWNVSAQYVLETNAGNFTFAVADAYTSRVYFDFQNGLNQKPYHLVTASIGWESSDRTVGIRLWGKNLTDERYHYAMLRQTTGDTVTPAGPRTYGVTLRTKFGG